MIYYFVNDEETIVIVFADFYSHLWILLVVFVQILLKVRAHFLSIDSSLNISPSLGEELQDSFIQVIIDKNNLLFRRFDEVGNEGISIKNLSIAEDSF